ncbi:MULTISPECIES: hypothetical protein [unclassified Streptomyces]|uniref:hypothetical protein n=1 Tax=unclassified Streptomyces TaxID=2593676 RepID=UPI0037F37F89
MVDDDVRGVGRAAAAALAREASWPAAGAEPLCLQSILYVLHNDFYWQLLPLELGFGSGQTC